MNKKTPIILLLFVFVISINGIMAQSDSPEFKQLFEIVKVERMKQGKKRISVKEKKMKVIIRSKYDLGNPNLRLLLNGNEVKYKMQESGNESVGVKVKVVTAVIYAITIECKGLLKTGKNEIEIQNYGLPQKKVFVIR